MLSNEKLKEALIVAICQWCTQVYDEYSEEPTKDEICKKLRLTTDEYNELFPNELEND